MNRTFAATLVFMLTAVVPAFAGDEVNVTTVQPLKVTAKVADSFSRPTILPVLYASYAGLQAYDVYSTRSALSRGAHEANPLMKQAAGNTSAMIALKAGVTLGTIVAAERMWKNNNKVGAIAVLVASNSVAAFVATRNARTLRQLR